MTIATQVYDNLVTKIAATLSTYKELPEPYEIDENPSLLLKKGFAVGFGPEENLKIHATNLLNFSREFNILLVNKLESTFNSRTNRAACEKALIEDGYTLIKAFCNDITLSGIASDIDYEGASGIEYVTDQDGTERFISIGLNFVVRYQDTF